MAAAATVQSRSKSLFPIPMPSFKAAGTGSLRSFTRAASPAPSTSSRRDDSQARSQSPFYAAKSKDAVGSSASIKSGKSHTGSLLSMRSLGKIASFARLGARARPAHPAPETFTYLKDLVLVDEPDDMDFGCGGEEQLRKSGSERGAYWGKLSDDDGERQGHSMSPLIQNHAISASPIPPNLFASPHDSHPSPDDMPTQTHTLPPGAATPAPTTSRMESEGMTTAINTPAIPANASENSPSSSSSNPLQRPRSKSRTIIRMLTTKFSHPSASSNPNDAHDASSANLSSSPPTTTHTHGLSLKIPKPSKPKAPPKVAPTAFADPAARAAALRARGLLPPLPVLDLSEQERERDARLSVMGRVGGEAQGKGDGNEEGETAADRIKREWAARHGIEIPTQGQAPEAGTESNAAVEVEADPQRAKMRAFKFGGGSTPVTPTVDTAATVWPDAKPEGEPVTPIALDIDVSLIDFSEPMQAPTLAPSPPALLLSAEGTHTITAGGAQGSTRSTSMLMSATATAPPAPLSAEATASKVLEAESVKPISIEISPPEALGAPITAAVPTARDSDNRIADNDWPAPPRSSAEAVQVPAKSEDVTSVSVPPRVLPALPPLATPVTVEDGVQEDGLSQPTSQLKVALLAGQESTLPRVVDVPSLKSDIAVLTPEPPRPEKGAEGERAALVDVGVDTESTALPRLSTPPPPSETPPLTASSPPTSPSPRAAFIQTPPASPTLVRSLPPTPGATVRRLPSLPEPTLSLAPPSRIESKNLHPLPLLPSLSSDTQASNESDDSTESNNSGSTTESASIVTPITPITPAYARSNNPFAKRGDANDGVPLVLPLPKGKLGNLSVKTQGGMGVLPVLVHSPATESMQGIPLEVVQEESQDGGWLNSQATTPAAVPIDRNPADDLLGSMGLDKGAFSRGLAEDNCLALGLGLDTTSPGAGQALPASLSPLTPVSPNRVPAVTISTPATGATPRNKKRGMTDPGAPERRRSLFGGFRKGDGAANESGEGAPQRRVSVVASLGNLRRSVVGTISGVGAEKKERDKKAASRSRSPRRFDASHLPPSPSPFAGFSTANAAANANMNVNVNDAYRNDETPGSPRTTSSHGSGSVLSHTLSTHSKTVLAPGSAPQLRRGTAPVPTSPVQRRMAVEPMMYSRGSILLEAANIEDEETRRMTEMAFLG